MLTTAVTSRFPPTTFSQGVTVPSRAQDAASEDVSTSRADETLAGSGDAAQRSPEETLTPEQKSEIQQLQRRDREVRAHEAAHVAAGGTLVRRGASFSYQLGPDDRRYAVGGEVSIDTAKVPGDPEATLAKATQVRRAALAPANPSPQDISVAAKATRMAMEARMALAAQHREEMAGGPVPGRNHKAIESYTESDTGGEGKQQAGGVNLSV